MNSNYVLAACIALFATAMACKEQPSALPEPVLEPPWLDPNAGTSAGIPEPPRLDLVAHYPKRKPDAQLEEWHRFDDDGATLLVVRCVSSVFVGTTLSDFAPLINATSAHDWKLVPYEDGVAFLDEHEERTQSLARPLTISHPDILEWPLGGTNSLMKVEQCHVFDAESGPRALTERMESDWRLAPVKQLADALGRAPLFLRFGRTGDQIFGHGTVVYDSAIHSDALRSWRENHGFVPNGFVEGGPDMYVVIGEDFEVELEIYRHPGGGWASLTTTSR